jgi:hypothetical protein
VRSLAIDPEEPNILYAGLGEGGGIYKSTDGGEFWGEINLGLQLICPPQLLPIGRVSQGMSLEDPPARFVGADYYSIPWTSVWDIVIDPANTQTIYAADHHSGVYLSTDGGANWNPINEELTTKAVTAMAISSDGEVLYAATEGGGVFRLGLCECEGNFDGDLDVDAEDVNEFLSHFGRSQFFNPCTNQDPCSGDFTCDADVDADDVTKFLEDFGRSQFFNPCPMCTRDPWCVY